MKIFFLILLIMAAGCTTRKEVITLQPEEFAQLISDENVFVLDTHIPEQEHIQGTDAFIPYNELEKNAHKLPSKDTPIAVYCRSGRMSAEAARTLQKMGYSKVYDLAGGATRFEGETR